jgi:hypothetical protein
MSGLSEDAMFTCEIILAAALIASPKECPLPTNQIAWLEATKPTLLTISVSAEILDPRERAYLFTQDLVDDLTMLQTRNGDLAWAPLLGECDRFPPRKTINDFLALNRAYRADMTNRLVIDLVHAEEIRTAICETDQLYYVWDTLRDAQCEYYYVTVRRQSLQLLRELSGPSAFYAGQMPPTVPVWHLPRIHRDIGHHYRSEH